MKLILSHENEYQNTYEALLIGDKHLRPEIKILVWVVKSVIRSGTGQRWVIDVIGGQAIGLGVSVAADATGREARVHSSLR